MFFLMNLLELIHKLYSKRECVDVSEHSLNHSNTKLEAFDGGIFLFPEKSTNTLHILGS